MILQALADYYDRARSAGALPPPGWIDLPLDYVIVLDSEGGVVTLIPRFEIEGKKRNRRTAPLPAIGKQAIKHTNAGNDPNILWDKGAFVLGLLKDDPSDRDREKGTKRLNSFKSLVKEFSKDIDSPEINAILKFYEKFDLELEKIKKFGVGASDTLTFKINTSAGTVLESQAVIEAISKFILEGDDSIHGQCLITGKVDEISDNHYSIKNVWGTNSEGPLVSFNKSSFESYGVKKGLISPIGVDAMVAYTTALNHLLRNGSAQRFQVGDASTVFWAEKADGDFDIEDIFSAVFGATPTQNKDDPDRHTSAVRDIYAAVDRGAMPSTTEKNKFFVLGLAPNAARIAIRFWQSGTVAEFSRRIKQHFDDLEICRAPHDTEYLPLFYLLSSIAVLGKADNIPPNLAGEVMRSILTGRAYPQTLLASAIRRCRAEQKVTHTRAAIVKACLNRNLTKEVITVALNKDSTNTAYRLGRLFAALERAQEQANPGINATIRERYYGAASSTPVSVFPTLLKLKNHHLAKLEVGQKIWLERLVGEIFSELPLDFPRVLNLEDQARFAVGYYHQRQDFFTKRNISKEGESK